MSELAFYQSQSVLSDPRSYAEELIKLPDSINELVSIMHHLILHPVDQELLNVSILPSDYHETNCRSVYKILRNIFSRSLKSLRIHRDTKDRAIGVCRDSALLLCSLLRAKKIPARLRTGFVSYFIPGVYLDGCCVEYFDVSKNRWRRIDTRTMPIHIEHYQLSILFDLTDIPDNQFITAAQAWKLCRSKKADPMRFGSRNQRGLSVIRNRMILELAVLNKNEMLLWDIWGAMFGNTDKQLPLLDNLCDVLLHVPLSISELISQYQSPLFSVPNHILQDNPFLSAEWINWKQAIPGEISNLLNFQI